MHENLERIGPIFDREASALFDHDLAGRKPAPAPRWTARRAQFSAGERDN
jgi:hypothetical protein